MRMYFFSFQNENERDMAFNQISEKTKELEEVKKKNIISCKLNIKTSDGTPEYKILFEILDKVAEDFQVSVINMNGKEPKLVFLVKNTRNSDFSVEFPYDTFVYSSWISDDEK